MTFEDDFSGYETGSNAGPTWEVVAGGWRVEDGAYVQPGPMADERFTFLKDPVVSDFELTLRFCAFPVGPGVKAAGVVFRAVSNVEFYHAHYDARNSQVILYRGDPDKGYVELARVRGVPLVAGEWHEAKITGRGGHMAVFLDGQLVTEVDDATYPAGRIGLRTGQGKIAFDDVQLKGTRATAPKEWKTMPQSNPQNEEQVPRLVTAERVIAVKTGGGYFPVLTKLQDGRLAAVVRGGDAHVGIKGRLDWIESADGGKTWSEPRPVVDSEWDDRNPAFGQTADGTIVLGYAECRCYNAQGQWDPSAGEFVLYYVTSRDGGQTWSEKRPLGSGPIRGEASPYGRIITLHDGTAIMSVYGARDPAYTGPAVLPPDVGPELVGIMRSRDNGETWDDFSLVCPAAHNETSFVELPDQTLVAALRTDGGQVDASRSTDGGHTWTPPVAVTGDGERRLQQHPADIIRLQSGNLLMVYGNRVEPFGVGALLSYDEGRTWDYDHRVMLGWESLHGDCGYPSAVQLEDGTIVCMYYSVGTYERPDDWQAIVVRFTEEQLRAAAGL